MPAAQLGPKARRLHDRRKQRAERASSAVAEGRAGQCRLATDDRALSYLLRRVDGGLYVERRQRRPLGADVTQSMVFATLAQFSVWCEAEPMRFDDPVLHNRLWRQGEGFFDADR
jgi:hypothetical protein